MVSVDKYSLQVQEKEDGVGELYETLKERIRDKKLEKLELELEL